MKVGQLVALCHIPTFCVQQVDLDDADRQNSGTTHTLERSEHTSLRQTGLSYVVALCAF